MHFSSITLLLSGLAFSAHAETTASSGASNSVVNQHGVEYIGINDYVYDTFMKPKLSKEEQAKECGEGVTKCLGGRDYLKCVEGKWVPAQCTYEEQSCRKGAMNNQCSEY